MGEFKLKSRRTEQLNVILIHTFVTSILSHMKLLLLVALLCIVSYSAGSSHSEAPGTAANPVADITDLYVFRSYETGREDYTVFVLNAHPLQAPFAGPNYSALSDSHVYQIHIDNDDDAIADFTFRFQCANRLGGPVGTVRVPDTDRCQNNLVINNENINQGIQLDINGTAVSIALKFAGQISAGEDGEAGLGFFEWCEVTTVTPGTKKRGDSSNPWTKVTNPDAPDFNDQQFRKPFDFVGMKTYGSKEDYEAYANQFIYDVDFPGCATNGRLFIAQRQESFKIPLGDIFDLINIVPIPGFPGAPKDLSCHDDLEDFNVASFMIEYPTSCLLQGGDGSSVIGVWSDVTELVEPSHTNGKQVSRLGQPLVNELAIGIQDKARFNAVTPDVDADGTDGFAVYVTHPTFPAIVSLLFLDLVNDELGTSLTSLALQNIPRNDLVQLLLKGVPGLTDSTLGGDAVAEMMRLNTSTAPVAPKDQNHIGALGGDLAGYPNGRRLGDDVVDITMRVFMGALCHTENSATNWDCEPEDAPVGNVEFFDGAPTRATDFGDAFPFMNTPNPGTTESPMEAGCSAASNLAPALFNIVAQVWSVLF